MRLIGIDNLRGDLFVGLFLGLSFIIANFIGLFSFAIPPVISTLSTNVGRLLIVVVLAPILEEAFFRGVVQNVFGNIFRSSFVAVILQAIAFGIFHLTAYSGVTLESFEPTLVYAVGGSFLSAILFGIIAGFVVRKTNNIAVTMIAHSLINFWLVRGQLVII